MGSGIVKNTCKNPIIYEKRKHPGLYLIRNSQSLYDYWTKIYSLRARDYKGEPTPEKDPEYKFMEDIKSKWDARLIDPPLTKKGKEDAIEATKNIAQLNVRHVFVSPLKRAIETSRAFLETYGKNKGNIKIFVHPLLRSILSKPKDIPEKISAKMITEYESLPGYNYNFTLLKHDGLHDEFFMLTSLNSPDKEEIEEELKKPGFNKDDYAKVIIEKAIKKKQTEKKFYNKLESFENARRRAVGFAEFLNKYIIEAGVKANEDILIFSHGNFISYCISGFWTPDGRTSYPKIQKCLPLPFNIRLLLEMEKDFASKRLVKTKLSAELMPGGIIKTPEVKASIIVPMQTCAKGHQLFFSRSTEKGGTFDCAKCLKGGKSIEGRWNCLFCKYDLCNKCKDPLKASKLKSICVNGHALEEAKVPEEIPLKYQCALCNKEGVTPEGQIRLVCIFCSYDICPNCK